VPHTSLQRLRAATLAAALLTAPVGAADVHAQAASPPAPTSPAVSRITSTARAAQILLINGDKLLVEPGRQNAAAIQQPANSRVDIGFDFRCSQTLRIPALALPYLGRGLDPSLFRLPALERAERGGHLPVRLSYHGTLTAVPGVTVTRSGRGTADGYLTGASARTFGTALRRQFLTDHARGSYGADGLFAHGLSIGLAGMAAPQRATPSFPMRTLTVTGSNLAGKPDTGDIVLVFNLDNCNKLDWASSVNTFYRGTAKFSVPAGHYWAAAAFLGRSNARLAILPQFTVSNSTTVHTSERAATSRITVKTPRPTRPISTSFTLLRSNGGFTEGMNWLGSFGSRRGSLLVSPVTHPPSIGTLHAYTQAQFVSPPGRPGIPYAYTLDFPAPPGIIPALHYTARPTDLATVHERYYQDVKLTDTIPPGFGGWVTIGGTPREIATVSSGFVLPAHMPGRQIQYLSAAPSITWQTWDLPWFFGAPLIGAWRHYHGGEQVTEDWNRYPLHPTPNAILPGAGVVPVLPSASRAGNTLSLDITPFGDNQPGELGSGYVSCLPFGYRCHGRYALYQNGVKILGGDAAKAASHSVGLFLQARLSPRPSLVKFMLTASRAGNGYRLSPTSKDVWTWRSRPKPGEAVPAPWYCGVTTSRGSAVYHRRCAVQPMTMLRYRVAGLSLKGATRPGRQQVAITASQIPLAPPFPVTRAGVQVSFDGGRAWHAATVTKLSPGHFRAVFSAPPGVKVTLRTHATGAAATSVTETIPEAYLVARR
jgi:hypothetical protein